MNSFRLASLVEKRHLIAVV